MNRITVRLKSDRCPKTVGIRIYPIAFLYRHYLELRLKELITAGQQFLDQPPDLQHVHRLDRLWTSCQSVLRKVWPQGSKADLEVVEACINELCRIDADSMSFRYPVLKDGKPTLAGMGRVSIRNLRDVIERISSLLEGSSISISEYLDAKRSMERDYCA
jgi:hypothetical protein